MSVPLASQPRANEPLASERVLAFLRVLQPVKTKDVNTFERYPDPDATEWESKTACSFRRRKRLADVFEMLLSRTDKLTPQQLAFGGHITQFCRYEDTLTTYTYPDSDGERLFQYLLTREDAVQEGEDCGMFSKLSKSDHYECLMWSIALALRCGLRQTVNICFVLDGFLSSAIGHAVRRAPKIALCLMELYPRESDGQECGICLYYTRSANTFSVLHELRSRLEWSSSLDMVLVETIINRSDDDALNALKYHRFTPLQMVIQEIEKPQLEEPHYTMAISFAKMLLQHVKSDGSGTNLHQIGDRGSSYVVINALNTAVAYHIANSSSVTNQIINLRDQVMMLCKQQEQYKKELPNRLYRVMPVHEIVDLIYGYAIVTTIR